MVLPYYRPSLTRMLTHFVKHWKKICIKNTNMFPKIAWVGILSEESRMPSVLCGIKISLFINPARLAGLAWKRSSKMWDWCLNQKGFQRSAAKESSGQTTILYLLCFGFNSQSYASAFYNERSCSQYKFIFETGFLRIIHFSGTENRCNSTAFPHSSNCHNVCTTEQTFASITSVCFHNKYSYIITQLFSNNADLDTKGSRITCQCTRWECEPLAGGVSKMKPLLNFDGTHSYIRTYCDLPFPPRIAGGL